MLRFRTAAAMALSFSFFVFLSFSSCTRKAQEQSSTSAPAAGGVQPTPKGQDPTLRAMQTQVMQMIGSLKSIEHIANNDFKDCPGPSSPSADDLVGAVCEVQAQALTERAKFKTEVSRILTGQLLRLNTLNGDINALQRLQNEESATFPDVQSRVKTALESVKQDFAEIRQARSVAALASSSERLSGSALKEWDEILLTGKPREGDKIWRTRGMDRIYALAEQVRSSTKPLLAQFRQGDRSLRVSIEQGSPQEGPAVQIGDEISPSVAWRSAIVDALGKNIPHRYLKVTAADGQSLTLDLPGPAKKSLSMRFDGVPIFVLRPSRDPVEIWQRGKGADREVRFLRIGQNVIDYAIDADGKICFDPKTPDASLAMLLGSGPPTPNQTGVPARSTIISASCL